MAYSLRRVGREALSKHTDPAIRMLSGRAENALASFVEADPTYQEKAAAQAATWQEAAQSVNILKVAALSEIGGGNGFFDPTSSPLGGRSNPESASYVYDCFRHEGGQVVFRPPELLEHRPGAEAEVIERPGPLVSMAAPRSGPF